MGKEQGAVWTLTNAAGMRVRIGSIGAAILTCDMPDRHGRLANVTLGLGDPQAYLANPDYLGVVVGRYAGRIAGARFTLEGRMCQLDANDGDNCLHGGHYGWHRRVWDGELAHIDGRQVVQMSLVSQDGDGGFPGGVYALVTYALTQDNQLVIDILARCDAPTPFSLTQHSYWNLSGAAGSTIEDHELSIAASCWLPTDTALIPTGQIASVAGTPLDLREARNLGDVIAATGGLDHGLLPDGPGLRTVAQLRHPPTGRVMRVLTDRPALQVYTGQHLGPPHQPFAGVALETQAPPDAPNQPALGDAIIRPGTMFRSRTIYAFASS